ncbi:glycosyltransferase family 2 protein [Candidatus Bathyarchaeota archaeon]|nr:glycosyltransferase family 2 protein [Candidatus Bathyarchaeota archaeon]
MKRFLRAGKKKSESLLFFDDDLPSVSIIVPAKNEEKVVGRLLKALVNLKYPSSKKEIIVVNDESNDRTGQICSQYASCHPEIRVFHRPVSTTKAAALNFGLQHAHGEIIATFDADSVLESDALLKAVKYLEDRKVAAVQGRICSINTNENILTRFSYYERVVQYEVYTQGKDTLNLFVGLAGTCQFIRRSVLEEVGGWNEKTLSEDVELSLRLTEKDYTIRYASDVRTWEESPNSIVGMVRQRARWYRGNIEMGLKFGKLMKNLNWRRFDAEMTLFGTYIIMLCVVTYFMAAWSFMLPPDLILTLITRFTSLLTLAILAFAGIALVCVDKPFRLSSLIWLPFIYAYWGFQSFIAMYALLQILFRRPLKWSKTRRSGIVTAEPVKKILATD